MSYAQSAEVYDQIYEHRKNYQAEVDLIYRLTSSVTDNCEQSTLLDVGCGTGQHDKYLIERFDVKGIDASPEMLKLARRKLPEIEFYEASMIDFDLACQFDVVISLFGAIGHLISISEVRDAIACMARHTVPGGMVIVEPWYLKGLWQPRKVETNLLVDQGIARVTESKLDGDIATLSMHYFVGWPDRTRYFRADHKLGMHSLDDFVKAFHDAGLVVEFDNHGITGRGLFVAKKLHSMTDAASEE